MRRDHSFLCAMFEGGGNQPLILPVVARLVERGNQVRVLAGPNIRRPNAWPPSDAFLDRIAATGAVVAKLSEPEVDPVAEVSRRGLALGWAPRPLSSRRPATDFVHTTRWSSAWAEAMADELRKNPVDVVVADFLLLGALAAGEHVGIPTAALVHNATMNWPLAGLPAPGTGFAPARNGVERARDMLWAAAYRRVANREGLPALNQARRRLGLKAVSSIGEQFDAISRVLILGSRTFDFPCRRLPPNLRYVGTPFDEQTGTEWSSPWAADDTRRLVLVSLSTLPQGQGPLMHRILDALAEMPVRALVTLGPSLDRAEFHAPPNAHVETFVPHASVLPQAAAVVTQCGLSTVTKALAAGVPMVCIPLIADQPDNAARIVRLGAGVRLRPDAGPRRIRDGIEDVLDVPAFRDAAQRVGATLKSNNGSESAAIELESLASSRSSPG